MASFVGGHTPRYLCTMCHKDFGSFTEANECITNHVKPVDILSYDDIDLQGPETLFVLMSDGSTNMYKLEEVVDGATVARRNAD